MTVSELIKKVRLFGLQIFKRYYGFYIGTVVDNNDPENLMRIKVVCPSLYGGRQFDQWIAPRGTFNGPNSGFYVPPVIGARVFITCLEGDSNYPYWEYGNFGTAQDLPDQSDRLQEAGPFEYVFKTPDGLLWHLSDSNNTITITQLGGRNPSIKIENGKFTISNDTADLKTEIDNLLDAVNRLTVSTAFGPSGTPLNFAEFQTIQSVLSELFN